MKKVLSLILVLTMVFSLNSFAIDVVTKSNPVDLWTKANSTFIEITDTQYGAQYFKAKKPFNGVAVCSPSMGDSIGGLTLSIYKWDTSIEKTMKNKPIKSQDFADYPDNTWLNMSFFTQPAGEYLITGTNGHGGVGMWVFTAGDETTVTYKNGSVYPNFYMQTRIFEIADPVDNGRKYEGTIDAYSEIDATKYSAGLGCKIGKMQIFGTGKEGVVMDTEQGGYIVFRDVDFGNDGAKGVKLLLNAGQIPDYGEFQLALDGLDKETLAKVIVEANNEFDEWQWIPATFKEKVTGKHDVYVVFKYADTSFASMQFTKEEPGLSVTEQRIADYKPVPDDELIDYMEDTWAGTDAMGRDVGTNADYGDFKGDKEVMMFYHTWQINANSTSTPANVNEIVKKDPSLKNDYSNKVWEIWASNLTTGTPCHWNESLYGFYTGYDEWVQRKNLEMLAAAGVDAIVTDCSNGNRTFMPSVVTLGKAMNEMRKDGIKAPKISFMLPWASSDPAIESMERLYQFIYKPGLFSDSWYYVEDKPLMMAWEYSLNVKTGNEEVDTRRAEMLDFFTFKNNHMGYKDGPKSDKEWAWLEVTPINGYGKGSKGTNPQMCAVGVAQNSNDEAVSYAPMNAEGIYGRSYTYKNKFGLLGDYSAAFGWNFQEQWDQAHKLDPDYVFVTGWNEQIMVRFTESMGVRNAMVDLYNDEYSRDIEPTKSYMGDNYYLQLADNVRKFKGVHKLPLASEIKTISLDGGFEQWEDVGPEFLDYKGDVAHRNRLEYGYNKSLVNNSGRNDIVKSKVARDNENMYFYVETADALTPSTDRNWMRLFVDSDNKFETGWYGYDYVINRKNPADGKVFVEKYVGEYVWENAGEGQLKVDGNKMMISVSKATLAIGEKVDILFKWADNTYSTSDLNDFYVNGDSAPLGRFSYRYTETEPKNKKDEFIPIYSGETTHQLLRNCVAMKLNAPYALAKSTMVQVDPNNSNITPKEINDRTLLPVRFLAESIGGKVSWSDVSKTATLTYGENTVKIQENANYLTLNNYTQVPLDVPAQTIDDRIFVPMRAICEALGLTVHWDPSGVIVAGDGAKELCKSEFFVQSVVNIASEW